MLLRVGLLKSAWVSGEVTKERRFRPMTPTQAIPVRAAPRSVESVVATRWGRLLVPSLSDLFLLAVMAWLFLSGPFGWQGLLSDGDAGWHIRTGEYILDNGRVPYTDPYSFSKPGAPWFAWEWLTEVIAGTLHRLAGLKGVVLAAGVVIAAFATTLVRRMVWRGSHLLIALVVALLGVGASSIHFLARPHVLTLLLVSVSVWMIEADRMRPSRRIWWLVPIAAVWTNLHGGFLALIAVLGLTAVGTAAEVWLASGRTIRDLLRYLALTASCGLATLLNPYGWNLHVHIAQYLRSDWIRTAVEEFQSPRFRDENMLQFEALLLAGLIASAGLFARRRLVEGLWIVFWAHMALSSARHVPVYVAVAAPLVAVEVSAWWNLATARAGKRSLLGIVNQTAADSLAGFRRTSLLPFAVVLILALMGEPVRWPSDFPSQLFPTEIVNQHGALLARSIVLTTDQAADYLIYRNPAQKVFIDGRSDFYGPEIGREFLAVTQGLPEWRSIMGKYGFDAVLLPENTALVQLIRGDPGWQEAARQEGTRLAGHSSDTWILLVRKARPVPSTGNFPAEPRF